jgi:N-methylhydantoinase B
MGATLRRAAYSANIKERLDFSCAVFTADARLLAQAAHIPVHLGAMEAAVRAATGVRTFRRGDIVVMNDPYTGGSHLPDLTTVSPVFVDERRRGFVATRAHHADIGGAEPASMSVTRDLFGEGLIIPPILLADAGGPLLDVMSLIQANSRTPEERAGDLAAQIASHRRGEARLADVIRQADSAGPRDGQPGFDRMAELALEQARNRAQEVLRAIPIGSFTFEDWLDGDGMGTEALVIRVRITPGPHRVAVDFEGTAPQSPGNVNAPIAVTRSAVSYVWACLLDSADLNSGSFECLDVTAPPGSLVNASRPVGVAGGNVETSQRIADVVLGALAQALPDRIPAASQGTMNNVMFGGRLRDGSSFTYYETLGGGAGGGPRSDGAHCIQVHMTNTANTPVEALEGSYPVRVRAYGRRRGSGGQGAHRGGDGLERVIEFLEPARVTLLTERRVFAPYGLGGGSSGLGGSNTLLTADGGESPLPGKCTFAVPGGASLRIQTPGGGGWGTTQIPTERDQGGSRE